jgi:hypothetical protein
MAQIAFNEWVEHIKNKNQKVWNQIRIELTKQLKGEPRSEERVNSLYLPTAIQRGELSS